MSQEIAGADGSADPELVAKVQQLIGHNRKRAFEMFQATSLEPVESIHEACTQLKVRRHLASVGQVPNVKLQDA